MTTAMRRAGRVLLIVAAPIVIGAAVVLVLALTPWGNERVRRLAVSFVNRRLNGELTIATLRGNLFRGATLTDVRVADAGNQPVFTARRVEVHYVLRAALRGQVVIQSAVLDTPEVRLDKRPGMKWNFQLLMKPGAPRDTTQHRAPPQLSDIIIHHGRFLWRRPWIPDSTLALAEQKKAIEKALAPDARRRVERVANGFQRVLDYHDIDARLPSIDLGQGRTKPLAVRIEPLSMLAEPYRPPAINVQKLVGTLYAMPDSLWWRGAHMLMPGSDVTGDGKIGFHRSGFRLDLTGAPVAFADLRWLDPKLSENGGGHVHYFMSFHGDSADFAVSDVNVKYDRASVAGRAAIVRIAPSDAPARMVLRDADLTLAQVSTSLIRSFVPSIKLRRDGTIGGHVAAHGSSDALSLDADLRFDDAAVGTSHVTARGEVAFAKGMSANGLRLDLRPLRLATAKGFGVSMPVDGIINGDANVTGAVSTGWNVTGDITHEDRGAISHVTGRGSYRVAGKRITADATLQPLSLITIGRLAPSAGLRGSVTGTVHAEGTTREMRLSGDVRSTDGGSVRGRGEVVLAGARTRYDVSVVADALNANAFTTRAPRTLLNGSIAARGTGTKPSTMNASVAVDLVRSRYDTLAVDRLLARGVIAHGIARIDTLALFERGARAYASGTFSLVDTESGALAFLLVADSLGSFRPWIGGADTSHVGVAGARQTDRIAAARADSAKRAQQVRIERLALGLPEGVPLAPDTAMPIRRDSLAGAIRIEGLLRGNPKEPAVEAHVNGSNLIARGMAAKRLSAFVITRGNMQRSTAPIDFDVTVDSLQATGRSFARVDAKGWWKQPQITASVHVAQDARVSYAVRGSYSHPSSDEHIVHLDSLQLHADTVAWYLMHPGGVRLSNAGVVIDSIDLRSSAGGRLSVNGVVPKESAIRLDIAAESVHVATVLDVLQETRVADGVINANARIEGTRASPMIVGKAVLRGASYKANTAPDADVNVRYEAQRLTAAMSARSSSGRRLFVGSAVLPLNLALMPVNGSRKLAGAISADAVMDSVLLAGLPVPTYLIEEVHGVVTGDAHVRGSWEHAEVTGRAKLREGGLRLPLATTGMRVDNAVADLRFTRDTIFLDSLAASARGPIRAHGTVAVSNLSRPVVNFVATGEDIRVFDSPRGLVDANARVFANGPLDSIRVTGTGEMLGGYLALKQFRKDLLRVKAPGSLSFFAIYDTAASAADVARVAAERLKKKWFGVLADLSLTIDPGNYYRNRPDANTEFRTGEGETLMAHLDTRAGEQWEVGFVRLDGGTTIFRTLAFVPQRGNLTFAPRNDAESIVQQVGERLVWQPGWGVFPIQLLTGGTSIGPAVGLESGTLFPFRGRELNGYLTLGTLTLSLLQQSGSSLSGSEAWSGQLGGETGALAHRQQAATALGVLLHDIGTGATKEWSLDAFTVSPNDVPTELVYGKTGGVRGARIEGGKYVTTDLFIAGQLHFTSGIPGARMARLFGTQYRLDVGIEPRFLFRSIPELGITHPTDRTGAFGTYLTRYFNW